MAFFYIAPGWFFGFDIFLELIFALVTGIVAFLSFKVYRLCELRECKLLGISFSLISASYLLWAVVNLLLVREISIGHAINLQGIAALPLIGVYLHILFFLVGLSFLVYFTFNIEGNRLLALIASLSLVLVVFSSNVFLAFNFVAALLLFYVAIFYAFRYKRTKENKGLLILISFILLFIARVDMVFATIHEVPYVANHLLEFAAYIILIVTLAIRRK